MKRVQKMVVVAGAAIMAVGVCNTSVAAKKAAKLDDTTVATECCEEKKCCEEKSECKETKCDKTMKTYQKKYTNADYYKDGVFQEDVAFAAILDLLDFYGVPFDDYMKKNIFISDFALGDFENVGMGGVFYMNDPQRNYLGHDIFLLPGQMIGEHYHVETEYPAKDEGWILRNGNCVSFGTGEPTENNPAVPASQLKEGNTTVAHHCVEIKLGDWVLLSEIESRHFLLAGDQGAIVTEVGTYHDMAGLRWTNPDASFVDIMPSIREKNNW